MERITNLCVNERRQKWLVVKAVTSKAVLSRGQHGLKRFVMNHAPDLDSIVGFTDLQSRTLLLCCDCPRNPKESVKLLLWPHRVNSASDVYYSLESSGRAHAEMKQTYNIVTSVIMKRYTAWIVYVCMHLKRELDIPPNI